MRLQRSLSVVFIFLVILSLGTVVAQLPSPTPADSPDPPYATVTYSDGSSVVSPGAGGSYGLVGLQAGQLIQVVVQLAPSHALQLYTIEALDGGAVLPPESSAAPPTGQQALCSVCFGFTLPQITSDTATLSFTFVPGSEPGAYRVVLQQGARATVLQFWVPDPQNPQNDPPAITPATPNNY